MAGIRVTKRKSKSSESLGRDRKRASRSTVSWGRSGDPGCVQVIVNIRAGVAVGTVQDIPANAAEMSGKRVNCESRFCTQRWLASWSRVLRRGEFGEKEKAPFCLEWHFGPPDLPHRNCAVL
jgi:hypothetical protein